MRRALLPLALGAFALLPACAGPAQGPYSPAPEAARDTARAQELSRAAADVLYEDPEQAESLLREALTADVFHGPAHNNLGVLYLHQDRLYEAANEFEWARKLLPGHPDPRMNLAITLEKAGRLDEALQTYETALEVYPGHVATEQALARLWLRTGKRPSGIAPTLEHIALGGESPKWREWAKRALQHTRSNTDHERSSP